MTTLLAAALIAAAAVAAARIRAEQARKMVRVRVRNNRRR